VLPNDSVLLKNHWTTKYSVYCFNADGKPNKRSNDVHGSPKVYHAVLMSYATHAFTLFSETVTNYDGGAFPNHLVSLYAAVGA
jgi:hypothetical protein